MTDKILILGNSGLAIDVAVQVGQLGLATEVVVDTRPGMPSGQLPPGGNVRELPMEKMVACHGGPGHFRVVFDQVGEGVEITAAAIVLAVEPLRQDAGLPLSGRVVSMGPVSADAILEKLDDRRGRGDAPQVVFATGLAKESHPFILREILQTCQELEEIHGVRTHVMTGNLKVGDAGLESMFRQTRMAGTLFTRFCVSLPEMSARGDAAVLVRYTDAIVGSACELLADLVVVDALPVPDPTMGHLARILRIDAAQDGFLQRDNVHRLVCGTSRRGIYAAGGARACLSPEQMARDAGNAALAAAAFVRRGDFEGDPDQAAVLDSGKCVHCLTCLRVCPYGAVSLEESQPVIAASECRHCGHCAAECPCLAISLPGAGAPEIREDHPSASPQEQGSGFLPRILLVCCSRSAAPALEEASRRDFSTPESVSVVTVACAGGLQVRHLLEAFSKGADGILVVSCHQGNCHAEKGAARARERVQQTVAKLALMGIDKKRLVIETVASNMEAKLSEIIEKFYDELCGIGPLSIAGKR